MASRSVAAGGSAPLVTICVPTIGRVEYLERVFADIDHQTYENNSVVVLDNASPPAARELISRFAAARPGVSVLRTSERIPMFANFNRGIAAARGEFVTFFHDDDRYYPSFLERHVAVLRGSPGAAFAGGNFDLVDGAGKRIRTRRLVGAAATWSGRRFIVDLMRRGRCALPTPGLVFRTSCLPEAAFDESLPVNWGDFLILMRMAETAEVAVLSDVTYAWRVHGQNFSNMPFAEAVELRTRLLLDYCDEYAARHPSDVAFTRRLRSLARRSHVRGLVWGWLVAEEPDDAAECLRRLRAAPRSSTVGWVLSGLQRAGLSLPLRRAAAPWLRRFAEG